MQHQVLKFIVKLESLDLKPFANDVHMKFFHTKIILTLVLSKRLIVIKRKNVHIGLCACVTHIYELLC